MADIQTKLKKRLEALLKLPENQICADCRKRGPRWASANLGIFFCIECSGIHRNLGVHISFVRSVNLDSWTPAQVEFMEEWGNKRANEYYEANLPAHVIRPKEGDAVRVVERFIRDKYEHKRYMGKIPPKNSEASAPAQETPRKVAPTATPAATRTPAAAAAPKPSPAPAPAPAPSLLDFDEPVVSPAPVATPQAAPVFDPFAAPAPVQVAHDFGAFTSAPTHAPPPAPHNNDFGDFTSAPAQQGWGAPAAAAPAPLQPAAPPKPQASADAILSLYAASGNRGGMPGPMGMGGHPHPGMMQQPTHMGMGMAPPTMGYGQPQNPFQQHQQQGHFPQQQQQQQQYGMHPGMQQQHPGMQQPYGQQPQPGYGQHMQQQVPMNPFAPRPMMQGMPMQGGPMMGMPQNHGFQQAPQGYPGHMQGHQPGVPVNPFGQQQAPQANQQQQQQQQAFSQLSWT